MDLNSFIFQASSRASLSPEANHLYSVDDHAEVHHVDDDHYDDHAEDFYFHTAGETAVGVLNDPQGRIDYARTKSKMGRDSQVLAHDKAFSPVTDAVLSQPPADPRIDPEGFNGSPARPAARPQLRSQTESKESKESELEARLARQQGELDELISAVKVLTENSARAHGAETEQAERESPPYIFPGNSPTGAQEKYSGLAAPEPVTELLDQGKMAQGAWGAQSSPSETLTAQDMSSDFKLK